MWSTGHAGDSDFCTKRELHHPVRTRQLCSGEMVNQEYHITARVRVGSAEFVMGECEKAPAPFVTWQRNCKNDDNGPPNFFWGHYRSDRSSCIEDFCERAGNEYKKQQNRTAQQEQNRTTPKKERGEAR